MAIGYPVSVGGINNDAAMLAIRWQQVVSDMVQFTNATSGLNVAALQALGFTFTDATNMADVITRMVNFAAVYYGTVTPTLFNFDADFLKVRGTSI